MPSPTPLTARMKGTLRAGAPERRACCAFVPAAGCRRHGIYQAAEERHRGPGDGTAVYLDTDRDAGWHERSARGPLKAEKSQQRTAAPSLPRCVAAFRCECEGDRPGRALWTRPRAGTYLDAHPGRASELCRSAAGWPSVLDAPHHESTGRTRRSPPGRGPIVEERDRTTLTAAVDQVQICWRPGSARIWP
jgi:hypothetical protein